MALMTLTDLPTEQELGDLQMSPESFLEVFHANRVRGLVVNVRDLGDRIDLGGYQIPKAHWFTVTA